MTDVARSCRPGALRVRAHSLGDLKPSVQAPAPLSISEGQAWESRGVGTESLVPPTGISPPVWTKVSRSARSSWMMRWTRSQSASKAPSCALPPDVQPELPRREDGQRDPILLVQNVGAAGDESVGLGGGRRRNAPLVVGVPEPEVEVPVRSAHDLLIAQE